jgi:transcriptional regulator with PAS, ATPase and Fis domain
MRALRSRESSVTPHTWSAPFSFADILGDSVALQDAKRLASTGYPTLLVGGIGTGKELFAQAIHIASVRPVDRSSQSTAGPSRTYLNIRRM